MAPLNKPATTKTKTMTMTSKIPVKSTGKGTKGTEKPVKTEVKPIKEGEKVGKKSENPKHKDPEDSNDQMDFETQNIKRKRSDLGHSSGEEERVAQPLTPTNRNNKQGRFEFDSSDDSEEETEEPKQEEVQSSSDVPRLAYAHKAIVKMGLDISSPNGRKADQSLDSLMELIVTLTVRCAKLEGKVETMTKLPPVSTNSTEAAKSYATMAQKLRAPGLPAKAQPSKKEPVQTVFLKPKDTKEFENMHEAKTHLMKVFNPNTEKVRIQNVRITKTGIIVETPTESEANKIGHSKDLGKTFSVEKPSKKLPRIIIYDVPTGMNETSLSTSVYGQNTELASTIKEFQAEFSVKFKTGKKEGKTVNWVVEVSPLMRNKILQKKRLYVEWSACRVRDFIMVTRCYKCQGFGHLAKHCERDLCCSLCAGTGHKGTECPHKDAKKEHKCVNCFKSKRSDGHSTLDKNCPAYKQALERLVERTEYGL